LSVLWCGVDFATELPYRSMSLREQASKFPPLPKNVTKSFPSKGHCKIVKRAFLHPCS
jgi:hypothetical protein